MAEPTANAADPGSLRIWNENKATDPRFCKSASNGRFDFTDIHPTYQIYRATKHFGPMGLGFGLDGRVGYDRLCEEGSPLWLATFLGKFWYIDPATGIKGEIPITASDVLLKDGRLNEEAGKMCMTSALKKGLSYLGYSADVYGGQWDEAALAAAHQETPPAVRKTPPPTRDASHVSKGFPKGLRDPKPLEWKVKFGQFEGKTWRDVCESENGKDYLEFLTEQNANKPDSDPYKKKNLRLYTELLQWMAHRPNAAPVVQDTNDDPSMAAAVSAVQGAWGDGSGDSSESIAPEEIHRPYEPDPNVDDTPF